MNIKKMKQSKKGYVLIFMVLNLVNKYTIKRPASPQAKRVFSKIFII